MNFLQSYFFLYAHMFFFPTNICDISKVGYIKYIKYVLNNYIFSHTLCSPIFFFIITFLKKIAQNLQILRLIQIIRY
jgi:hypothetical protein